MGSIPYEGFVEEKEFGIGAEATGEREAAFFSSGEGSLRAICERG
jgi:hypothetical protein